MNETQRCSLHPDQEVIWEEGGPAQPTIHGRRYCPACQDAIFAALDELGDS